MIERNNFLSRAAADISHGVAALGEVIEEMICDRTHWKHSIKAGAWALREIRASLFGGFLF